MPHPFLRRFLTADALLRLLVLLIFVAFLQTVFFGFVYDDFPQITTNAWLVSAAGLKAIFTHHSWGFDPGFPARHYRPVFLVWLWLVRNVFGPAPGFFHLAAVLNHVLASLLAFVLCRELLDGNGRLAALVAMIFALHPSKVESVAWISAAPESLNAIFLFASMYAYIRGRKDPHAAWKWLTLSSVSFAAALLTKETAVILPALLLAWEILIFRAEKRESWKLSFACVAPLLTIMAVVVVVRSHILNGVGDQAASESIATTLYNAPLACWLWIRQLFLPFHLSTLYPLALVQTPSLRWFVLPAIGLLLLIVAYWKWAKSDPVLKFAGAWLVLTALPVIGEFTWVQLHDRHLYLPLFAFALMLVIAAQQLLRRAPDAQQSVAILCVSLALVFTAISADETRVWDSQITVFERAVQVAPENTEAIDLLASGYISIGQYPKAEAILRSGLQRVPKSARLKIALGSYLDRAGRTDEAQPYLRSALAMELPNNRRSDVLFQLSIIDWNNFQRARAKEELREAIRLQPDLAPYKMLLARYDREQPN